MDKRSLAGAHRQELSRRANPDLRRANQAGDHLHRFLGKPRTPQKRIRRAGAESHSRPTPRKSPSPAATATCAKTTNTRPPRKCRKSSCAAKANWKPNSSAPAAAILPIPAPTSSASAPSSPSPTWSSKHAEQFTVLGAWDSDPDKGVISYLTPVAQSLLNHKIGDQVEFDMDGAKKLFRIDTIAAYKPTEAAPAAEPAPASN